MYSLQVPRLRSNAHLFPVLVVVPSPLGLYEYEVDDLKNEG